VDDSADRRYAYRQRIERNVLQEAEKLLCGEDIVHFTNQWLWTFDPRLPTTKTIPFDLFPIQSEFLLWLRDRQKNQESGLVEKSRDMGATFLAGADAVQSFLFHPSVAIGFGSRKLELVDKIGDPDCIFEKIRFLLYSVPAWMMPRGFKREQHDNFAKLLNPETGATITGEGGDNIGRGGRKTRYYVDEAAFLEHPEMIERSLSQNTNVRIDISTPNGSGNPFALKRFSEKVPVFTLHWKDDPRKGEAWYAEQVRKFDPVTVAQEIDIDYKASGGGGHFLPDGWPRYANRGDAWGLMHDGAGMKWDIVRHIQCTLLIAVDWAMGKKKTSDLTAIVVAVLTPDGRLLIIDVVNERIRYEDNAIRLAQVCRQYPGALVAGDDDMLAEGMMIECRRHREIPEIRRMKIAAKPKLTRAFSAIIRGQNGRIFLPEKALWLQMFCHQLTAFTGIDIAEKNDIADGVGILGRLADELKPVQSRDEFFPEVLEPGRNIW